MNKISKVDLEKDLGFSIIHLNKVCEAKLLNFPYDHMIVSDFIPKVTHQKYVDQEQSRHRLSAFFKMFDTKG